MINFQSTVTSRYLCGKFLLNFFSLLYQIRALLFVNSGLSVMSHIMTIVCVVVFLQLSPLNIFINYTSIMIKFSSLMVKQKQFKT